MEIYRYLVSLSSLGPSLYRGSTVLPLQYYLLAISNLLKTHLNLIKIIILALESKLLFYKMFTALDTRSME